MPLIDYAGFMFIACNHHAKEDLQIMQNDILRICCQLQYKLSDRISIGRLHKECKIIGIEQLMQKQLLRLMFLLSKNEKYRQVRGRDTRSANKINFKVPNKISHVYMNIHLII